MATKLLIRRFMHHASYCDMYISIPTRCTDSYNVFLFIIKRSTCFGLFSPSSGTTFFESLYRNYSLTRYKTSILCLFCYSLKQLRYTATRNVAPDNGLKNLKYVERLMFNILKPTGYVIHQQFNIQQLYVLPTLYLCVLYLSENKQQLVPLTA